MIEGRPVGCREVAERPNFFLLRGHLLGLAGRIPPLTQFFWKRAAGL